MMRAYNNVVAPFEPVDQLMMEMGGRGRGRGQRGVNIPCPNRSDSLHQAMKKHWDCESGT
jgi:hypothetical protein